MSETKEKNVTDEMTSVLEEIVETPVEEKKKGELVTMVDDKNLLVGERQYQLVKNYRDGFDADMLGERFSDVLSRYDYVVGDWGYEKLRLKGFFRSDDRKSNPEQRIDTLEDYLYEYCNFGCAFFVIERTGGKRSNANRKKRKRPKNKKVTNQAYTEEKKVAVSNQSKKKPVIKNRKPKKETTSKPKEQDNQGRFVIRQREE
ncbi:MULTISPECIES: YutD family protein [Enterococcus]|uniref:YutD family protein n=1 Tax=Enterococcus alishanensis TaxID=1303817 RepID=A0ABS6THC6_9ENTE|nr:YutD family protein [Enterococcus alishanensis]MBV7392303.1 YutD family protein [Enterococcus alishanensis]